MRKIQIPCSKKYTFWNKKGEFEKIQKLVDCPGFTLYNVSRIPTENVFHNAYFLERRFNLKMKKRIWALVLAVVLCMSLLPTVTLAASTNPVQAGYLVELPIKLDGRTEVYMGIGQLFGDIYIFTDGQTSDESSGYVLSVCLWAKTMNGGLVDYRRLEGQQADSIFAQLEDISLTVSAAPGATNTGNVPTLTEPQSQFDYLQQAGTRCQKSCQLFSGSNGGRWCFTASCKVGEQTYSASATVTQIVPEIIIIDRGSGANYSSEVDTVDAVNAALKSKFNTIDANKAQPYNVFVNLKKRTAYTGQIVIPTLSERTGSVFVFLSVENRERATLQGGVYSENVGFSASYINFIGAGKDKEKWPADSALAGKDNIALAGDSSATSSLCSFTGYDRAIQCTKGLRACGGNNIFKENHIAWYLDAQEGAIRTRNDAILRTMTLQSMSSNSVGCRVIKS